MTGDHLPPEIGSALPPAVAERTNLLNDRPVSRGGGYVLYWMRTAVRGHENPALDAAVALANGLGLPAFVYHALDERYPYASDRHHTFILEGARDVAAELAGRGIGYAFHLSRPGHRGPHLKTLAEGAAAVVTEDMPTVPMTRWARALADAAPVAVLAVDTACVLPMRLVGRSYDRAFAFRKATTRQRDHRLRAPWTDVMPDVPAFRPDLPFEPVDLATASIPDLVADCEIDHGVGPIAHTRGGSSAGYARWADFRDHRLARYARRRNDATDRDAVSRMSAYLHYGHVSPLRIAREAAQAGGAGADKFLDELLVWREMAHVFSKYEPDHEDLSILPDWAHETLAATELDRREALYSWEDLARGATDEPLWNAAQWSLHRQGELHNNLRMTWGKEVLGWTPDAATALDRLIDLNHRYALDGRDPNSYGGLLWCLGAFDRPFDPPQPVFGRVRARSAAIHARRLDVDAYTRMVAGPAGAAPSVAVVGAGIAGLACTRTLADHGWSVTAFDKGRGPGGRMSTRRANPDRGVPAPFDHGAQYFTADDPRFRRFVDSWVEIGVAARWDGRIVTLADGSVEEPEPRDRFVGAPAMNDVVRHLGRNLDVRYGLRVGAITRDGDGWRLTDEDGGDLGTFGAVVVAVPAPQAEPLLRPVAPDLADRAAAATMAPCWAAMAAFDAPVAEGIDGAFVRGDGALSWIARNGAKPDRDGAEAWVLHASPDWSRRHLEETPDQVAPALLAAFGDTLANAGFARPPEPTYLSAHRWRYARAEGPFGPQAGPEAPLSAAGDIVLCGDWCRGGKIQDAWLSGIAAAGRLMGQAAARTDASITPGRAAERQMSLFA